MKKKVYPATPEDSMCKTFTYEYKSLEVNTIENYLSEIDNKVAPKVKNIIKLIEDIKNGKANISTTRAIVETTLKDFLCLYYRSGALLTEFSSLREEEKIPLLLKKILDYEYLNDLANVIKDYYSFAIIESPGDFLISDQFISTSALRIKTRFLELSNRHIGLNETLILIPISSHYYIAYWNTKLKFFLKENQINILNEEEIKQINDTIINNSYVKCVGMKRVIFSGIA